MCTFENTDDDPAVVFRAAIEGRAGLVRWRDLRHLRDRLIQQVMLGLCQGLIVLENVPQLLHTAAMLAILISLVGLVIFLVKDSHLRDLFVHWLMKSLRRWKFCRNLLIKSLPVSSKLMLKSSSRICSILAVIFSSFSRSLPCSALNLCV